MKSQKFCAPLKLLKVVAIKCQRQLYERRVLRSKGMAEKVRQLCLDLSISFLVYCKAFDHARYKI